MWEYIGRLNCLSWIWCSYCWLCLMILFMSVSWLVFLGIEKRANKICTISYIFDIPTYNIMLKIRTMMTLRTYFQTDWNIWFRPVCFYGLCPIIFETCQTFWFFFSLLPVEFWWNLLNLKLGLAKGYWLK